MAESRSQLLARLKEQRRKAGIGEFKRAGSRKRKNRSSSTAAPRRRRRRVNVAKRRSRKGRSASRSSGGVVSMKEVLFHAGYGYGRPYLVNLVGPYAAKLPMGGDFKLNIALGGGAYLLGKYAKPGPEVRQALKTVVLSEAFLVGAKASAGGSISTTGSTVTSGQIQVL